MKYVKIIDGDKREHLIRKDSIVRISKDIDYDSTNGKSIYKIYYILQWGYVSEKFDNYEDRDAVFDSMQRELEDE